MSQTQADAADRTGRAVDHDRLQSRIAALARYGEREDGGVSRETLTAPDLDARRHLIDEARALGCEVAIDDCANLYFRRPGTEDLPPVLTGSHIDTQPIGGKLDGAYGVIGGLEAISALNDAGIRTRHPIEVVAWTNEEGCRFAPGAMGSSAFVEPARLAGFRRSEDGRGVRFGDALDRALSAASDLVRRPLAQAMAAYVELHIEQGPILEQAGLPLGVVTGIQGVRWYRLTCTGEAAHAGTTPMDRRADAMIAALEVALRLHGQAGEAADAPRVTLGRWTVEPNSVNTIASKVTFTVDTRCPDDAVLTRFEVFLEATARAQAWRGVIDVECFFRKAPTIFPEDLVKTVGRSCDAISAAAGHGVPLRLSSGAFHDAMYLAQHGPAAMIFVPSKYGISHNAAEATDPEALTLGVRALAHTLAVLGQGM